MTLSRSIKSIAMLRVSLLSVAFSYCYAECHFNEVVSTYAEGNGALYRQTYDVDS
jgi:hypothetical protein